MKLMTPVSMIQWRIENPRHNAERKSDRWITREIHQGRDLIRDIRRRNSLTDLSTRKHRLKGPKS
jgi:hypothetical protein